MTVKDLIEKLSRLSPYREIMLLDGNNGQGMPREINLGPVDFCMTDHEIEECADCEEMTPGTFVYVIGYGCY